MSAPERPRRNPKVALPNPEAGLYPAERAPDDRGEAAVWRAFGKHRPQGWTVWHHIVTGRGLNQAEIDFVIAIPGKGIVLLEVKAGQLTRREQKWYQNGHLLQPQPGEQLERARKTLISDLRRTLGVTYLPEIGLAVCFPETSNPSHVDIGGLPILFQEDMKWFEMAGHASLSKALSGKAYPPNEGFLGTLHALWGPDWQPMQGMARLPDRVEVAWRQLTADQAAVLGCLSRSRRLLVEGPPGSGKTVLLMSLAHKLQQEGKRVLVATYTKAIAAELHRAGVRAAFPLRDWALERARDCGVVVADADVSAWRTDDWHAMVREVTTRVASGQVEADYDYVFVDEYQDLGDEDWPLVDALVKGATALWLFGDEGQRAMSHAQGVSIPERLAPGGVFTLRAGLRCPAPLLDLATQRLRGDPAASDAVTETALEACLELSIIPDDADDAARLAALQACVERALSDEDVRPHDLAVLSFASRVASRQSGLTYLGARPLQLADDEPTEGGLLCDTVLRAKGLERPIVVLTDLDRVSARSSARALYIALTRASARCVLVGTAAEVAQLLGR